MKFMRSIAVIAALTAGTMMTGCENNMDENQTNAAAKAEPKQGEGAPAADKDTPMPPLTPAEARVIRDKGTEYPYTGKYWDFFGQGVYLCRQCGAPLYRSDSKFRSDCGWPSFDDEIDGAVTRKMDADGRRTEILCAKCDGHLGHVFEGEGYTAKDTRHCVNSISLVFKSVEQLKREQAAQAGEGETKAPGPADKASEGVYEPTATPAVETAIFAGGCFWGVEHHFDMAQGVVHAESGYTGGHVKDPTYQQVCTGRTGHAEAVRVVYDPSKTSYEKLARLFFETHDPTTLNRQGPDVGSQYRSAVFYANQEQKRITEKLIGELKKNGYEVVTEVKPASEFYPAEEYHQDYLVKHPGRPDCHIPVSRFEIPLQRR